MKNVSSNFRNELNNGNRNYIKSADIKLKNGTILTVDNSKLWNNGLKIENAVSNTDSFDISSVIIGQLTLTILNIDDEYSGYDFTDCTVSNVKVGLQLEDGTIESLSYGTFYLNEATYSSEVITLTFYDCLYKFDKNYSESNLQYPATLNQIVRDACDVCGVTMGTVTFDNDDYIVQERPEDDSLTFRQVLLWVGQISVNYFYADEEGRLAIGWYDIDGEEINDIDTIESVLRDVNGDVILDVNGNQIITDIETGLSSFVSLSTQLDDVVITGIQVLQDIETDNGQKTVTYQSGKSGYILSVSGNKLIQGDQGSYTASMIAAKVVGVRFRGFSATCLSDPTIECGDSIILVDRKGRRYKSIVTNNTFQPGNFQNLLCSAETPARNSATRYSQITQVYVDYRKEIEKEKTEREEALEDLGNRINTSSGVFTTIETLADGSQKFYLHNKPMLSESDIIWIMTAEAWGVSTDGGKTINSGMTVDGDTIVRILTAVGINADWIKSGAISIEDPEGNETFFADTETGQVRILANSFALKGKTIEEITKEELENQIEDLVIGNVNLQRNSNFDGDFSYWSAETGWEISTENQFEGVNSAQFSRTGIASDSARDLYSEQKSINATSGEYYTASAYFYTDDVDAIDSKVTFGFWYYDKDNSPVFSTDQTVSLTVSFTNKRWIRHVITAIAPENTAYISMYIIAYRNGTFCVAKPQLEKGNIVTGWKLAPEDTDNYVDNLIADLKEQIDGKIQTYNQAADPSSDWNAEEKEQHIGDLWYNPDQKNTKRWDGESWELLQDKEAIDASELAKTKAQVFYATPTPPYNVNDLWVQGETGDIMRCKTARSSGNYVATDWEKASKYTDDSAVDDLDEVLNQQGIFNRLTNDGLSQGIFLENGQLYLNGEYMEFDGATIGGWLVSGNQLRNDQTNFEVKFQAPTVYGTSGLSTADIIAVHDKEKDTWPFVVTSDGSMDLGDEFQYRPNGFAYDSTVQMNVGGWQIKKTQNVWGYNEVIYWDTIETQTNGIGAKGPWVIWGGWNGGASLDYVNNYKFVVSDVGDVYAQRFFDNGQQLLPIVVEVMHKTLTNDFCYVSKSGYYLLSCYLIRSVDHNIYVKAIQYRNDNTYTVALQGANGGEIDLYTMWAKMPD